MPTVSGSPTQLKTSVLTLADLEGQPDDAYLDGDMAYVASTRATYQLDRASTATRNGSTVLSAYSSNGRWNLFATSITWESQTTWFIDPVNGSDEGDGATTSTAIRTWAEFVRRVRLVNVQMTVTILSNIAEELRGTFETTVGTSWLWIKGSSTVLASGSASACVDPIPATNTRSTVTVTDLTTSAGTPTDFTNYVGKMLRSPVDADGPIYLPVLKVTAGVAQSSYWAENLSTTKPINGALIEVIDLITAPTVQIFTSGGLPVRATEIQFTTTGSTSGDTPCITDLRSPQPTATGVGLILLSAFNACIFNSGVMGSQTWFISCLFSQSATGVSIVPMTASCLFSGGGSLRSLYVANPGTVQFQGFTIQGGKLSVGATSTSTTSTGNHVHVAATVGSAPLGIFDSTGNAVEVYNHAAFNLNSLYGSGNAAIGLVVGLGGKVKIVGTPTLTATTQQVQMDGANTAIPALTGGAVVPAAAALTSWAEWVALGRKVQGNATGSLIAG